MTLPERLERAAEGSGVLDARRVIGQLRQIRDRENFTATRVGDPGCAVRLAAADNVWALDEAIRALEAPAQSNPENV